MYLVFVCEIDGFQHGLGPFALKRTVLISIQEGTPTTFKFNTEFLADKSQATQQTFCYKRQNFEGLPVALLGLHYDSCADTLSSYLKYQTYSFLEKYGDYSATTSPSILLLVKGEQKCSYISNLLPTVEILVHLEIQNLEE